MSSHDEEFYFEELDLRGERAHQQRAEEHGLLIKRRRLDLGLKRPAFVSEVAKLGQEMSADYLNKLEAGTRHLANASPALRDAIRQVLGISIEDWTELTGLYAPSAEALASRIQREADRAQSTPQRTQSPLRPIPTELTQMIDEKGHLAEELLTERWQQYLAGQRFSTGRATPERWWNLFLLLKNAGVEPGGN